MHLTTYTHHSELQLITAVSPISTLYKSLQHLFRLFQPPVFSQAVPWQRLLTAAVLQLHWLRSSCHGRPCINLVNCQLNYSAVSPRPSLQRSTDWLPHSLLYNSSTPTALKTLRFSGCIRNRCSGKIFTEPLPRNVYDITAHLKIIA
jgi:hypothetical protein